jgi:hypothetical protein
MNTNVRANEIHATNSVAEIRGELSLVAESCKWFPGLAKWLSPTKPATHVHYICGEPERSCYAWVEGKNDPPSRAVIRMLRSDDGWRVFQYIMRGCDQPWWHEVLRAKRCADAYEREREQFEFDLR